jgi:hypothetical protein
MENKPKDPKNQAPLNFGWTVIGQFLVCSMAGYFADQKFGTGYIWTFVGLGTAVVLLVYELWKLTKSGQ